MKTLRLSSSSVWQTLTLSAILLFFLSGSAFAETVIYSFKGSPDGSGPDTGLTRGKHGVLYGTTTSGGQYGDGTVFELTPPAESGGAWTETVLYSFTGADGDGYNPEGPVILDKSGNLYGTTYQGGPNGFGCVFELTPPAAGGSWTETIIYGFGGRFGDKGIYPGGPLTVGWEGSLYGTTEVGGAHNAGTVFRLAQEKTGRWIGNVAYSLGEGGDGSQSLAGVISDKAGNLYGTTLWGGGGGCIGGSGCGTVFELSPPAVPGTGWTEALLYSFTGENGDGAVPGYSPLIFDGAGNLYGTTVYGGSGCPRSYEPPGCGTVFELSPSQGGGWTEMVLYVFTGGDDGSVPFAGLILDEAGNLYGEAYNGGRAVARGCPSNGCGTVFELSPPSSPSGAWTETTLHEFKTGYEASIDGIAPFGSLVFGLSGSLYGTTVDGGAYGQGAVFSVHP